MKTLINHESSCWEQSLEAYFKSRAPVNANFLWTNEEIKTHINNFPKMWVGLKIKESLLAIILFSATDEVVEINYLETKKEFLRQGYMVFLLSLLIQKNTKKEFWLDVHELNFSALSMYKKMGFAICGRRENYYKDGGGALLMKVNPFQT